MQYSQHCKIRTPAKSPVKLAREVAWPSGFQLKEEEDLVTEFQNYKLAVCHALDFGMACTAGREGAIARRPKPTCATKGLQPGL